MKFSEFGLNEQLLEALSYMGFEEATPIQEQAIPIIMKNKDLMAFAQTGTGKTGAFVIPILHMLVEHKSNFVDTLIIVPTRELAVQIEQQIQGLSYFIEVGSLAVYGGGDGKGWDREKDALNQGTEVIVATPGKLLAHLKMGDANFKHIKHLVLDEADRMLDMGFIEDIQRIITYLPEKHQTLMFSATMPNSIRGLAKKIMKDPEEISLAISKPAEGVDQKAFMCYDNQKIKLLQIELAKRTNYESIIIFTSTKSKVSEIVKELGRVGLKSRGISSNLSQPEREEVLQGFKSRRIRILVATDVMSRGIDVKEINMVINYDVPHDAEDYVHRVGRTARVGTTGEAFTLVNPDDMQKMADIERLIAMEVPKLGPPEEVGQGPKWNPQGRGGKKNFRRPRGKGNFKGKRPPRKQ